MKAQKDISYMGKTVVKDFDRIPKEIIDQFAGYITSHYIDKFGKINVMDPKIHQLNGKRKRIIGSAVTVNSVPDNNFIVHIAFDYVKEGDILVINGHSEMNYAQGGGLMASMAQHNGAVGIVVDGAWRDLDELDRLDFPVYGRGRQAAVTARRPGFGEINTPVACGGVVVNPGDLVVADEMGVVVVPQEYVLAAIDQVKARAQRDENTWADIEGYWKMHAERNKELAEQSGLKEI